MTASAPVTAVGKDDSLDALLERHEREHYAFRILSDPEKSRFQIRKLAEYQTLPWHFLKDCVFTLDQVDKRCPIKPFPADLEYLELLTALWLRELLMAIPKSRRMTCSWNFISLYLWDTIFHSGRFNGFVSKKEDDAGELVERAEFIYHQIPEWRIPRALLPGIKAGKMTKQPPVLEFPEINSKIQGFPQGAGQLRQYTLSGILGDECAFWEQAQQFYSASQPTLEGGGRMTLISSRSPGFFKKIVFDQLDSDDLTFKEKPPVPVKTPIEGVELWKNPENKFLVIDLHYTANPRKRGKEWREAVRRSMPLRDFLMEYEKSWQTYEGRPVYEDFNPSLHKTDIIEIEPGIPLLIGWDFGLCYDDETEVLTDSGWKLFKDVNESTDKVATLNPETFEATFEHPELKVDMPYEGDLYYCNGQNLNFAITPDHIVPNWTESGTFERHYAKDLLEKPGHRKLRLTAKFVEGVPTSHYGLSANLEAALLGLYLSDGTSDGNKLRIVQTKDNEFLNWIMTEIPWPFKKDDQGYVLHNTKLASAFKAFGLQRERRIPRHIINGTRKMQEYFLAGYTSGDGHTRTRPNGSEEHTIFTCSKGMADDLQELAARLGWNSSIRIIKPTTSYYKTEQRWITNTGGYSVTFKKNRDWAELRSYNYERRHYSGRVYCLKVSHHTLYVRRNGRPHWNGNTPACVVCQLVGNQLRIIKEFIETDGSINKLAPKVWAWLNLECLNWIHSGEIQCFIDPAGFQRAQTDESTCAKVLREHGFRRIKPGPVRWEARRQAVEHFLTRTYSSGPALLVSEENAPIMTEGFSGGYQYPDKAKDIEPTKIMPLKNKFSHPHDAFQYVADGARALRKEYDHILPEQLPAYGFQKGN